MKQHICSIFTKTKHIRNMVKHLSLNVYKRLVNECIKKMKNLRLRESALDLSPMLRFLRSVPQHFSLDKLSNTNNWFHLPTTKSTL